MLGRSRTSPSPVQPTRPAGIPLVVMYEWDTWIHAVLKPGEGLTRRSVEQYLARYEGAV